MTYHCLIIAQNDEYMSKYDETMREIIFKNDHVVCFVEALNYFYGQNTVPEKRKIGDIL